MTSENKREDEFSTKPLFIYFFQEREFNECNHQCEFDNMKML